MAVTGLTEALGVTQSDVLVRGALLAAIADLRANSWLLDYVFSSLPKDSLTNKEYGAKEVDQAKKWFLKTDIKVLMDVRVPDGNYPPVFVAIRLNSSEESRNTLSDIHHQPFEDAEGVWAPLTAKFTPTSYSPATGRMRLPSTITDNLIVATGMVVTDRTGTSHEILDVLEDGLIELPKGLKVDFHECFIKSAKPSFSVALEGAEFRESYLLTCAVVGEAVHLTYLHSIIVFCLLRYREQFLDARGLEVSSITSSDFRMSGGSEEMPEIFFTRHITLSGTVRHYWPKAVTRKTLGFGAQMQVLGGEHAPDEGVETDDLMWIGDLDPMSVKF